MDPFILTSFIQATPEGDEDPIVSLVIFEWKDEDLVGVWPSEDAPKVGAEALHFHENLTDSYWVLRKHSSAMMQAWSPLSAKVLKSVNSY